MRGDILGEHIFERFPYILGNLERHVYTQGGHMLRKIERMSYDFILAELYAKCKQEVKAKAELENGVTKEGVTQQEPIYKNLKYFPLLFQLAFLSWLQVFKDMSVKRTIS